MARCSQPQAVLRGGLRLLRLHPASSPHPAKSPRCFASELGGHITPEWMLHSNLRLLCGNHHGMRSIQPLEVKNMEFSGCYGGWPSAQPQNLRALPFTFFVKGGTNHRHPVLAFLLPTEPPVPPPRLLELRRLWQSHLGGVFYCHLHALRAGSADRGPVHGDAAEHHGQQQPAIEPHLRRSRQRDPGHPQRVSL